MSQMKWTTKIRGLSLGSHKVPTPEIADHYLGASILLPQGSTSVRGRVKSRMKDPDGNLFGVSDPNPIKDTCTYEVEFPGGEIAEITANAIAEAMYAQCDDDGNEYLLMIASLTTRRTTRP